MFADDEEHGNENDESSQDDESKNGNFGELNVLRVHVHHKQ